MERNRTIHVVDFYVSQREDGSRGWAYSYVTYANEPYKYSAGVYDNISIAKEVFEMEIKERGLTLEDCQ
jgi:hypothetical protein